MTLDGIDEWLTEQGDSLTAVEALETVFVEVAEAAEDSGVPVALAVGQAAAYLVEHHDFDEFEAADIAHDVITDFAA